MDFCRRAADAGYRIEYVPSVTARHIGGHSILQVPGSYRAMYWCDSLLRYAMKHFGPLAYRGVCMAVMVSAVPRMVAGIIQERSLAPAATYFKIVKLASRRLVSQRLPAA